MPMAVSSSRQSITLERGGSVSVATMTGFVFQPVENVIRLIGERTKTLFLISNGPTGAD